MLLINLLKKIEKTKPDNETKIVCQIPNAEYEVLDILKINNKIILKLQHGHNYDKSGL